MCDQLGSGCDTPWWGPGVSELEGGEEEGNSA